ncbi:MAG TPA: DUF2782 domain-containing protein [Thiotrichaceae bacterium]|nr:DUF2782 domain-containing protein [Thiotrichaceae bacterium]HIM07601.1 DUF2782 domain-containing protein [Gammaproteobacteria bacterium]
MDRMKRLLIILGLLFASTAIMAGNSNPGGLEPVPEPPELPDPLETGENIEPVITIIHKDDAVIEEYSVNGVVYMVKITPVVGPSYYMVDDNGDGNLTSRRHRLDKVSVPQWVLFRW